MGTAEGLTSLDIVLAKAKANPAVEADIPGVKIATNPVAPTTAAESRLKRADSHRLTNNIFEILRNHIN